VTQRHLPDRADLDAHLGWLRVAIHDRQVDARLVMEGLLDAIEALTEMAPGPPSEPGPP
jgi:hypothetical protein